MNEPVKCICGGDPDIIGYAYENDEPVNCSVKCVRCDRRSRSWNADQRALKHHDLLTGFVEEVKAQTASANTADMAALHSMAVAVQKEMEE